MVFGASETVVDTSGVVDGSVFESLLPHAVSNKAATAKAENERTMGGAYPAIHAVNLSPRRQQMLTS
ncbi:hypothetical protein BH09ACT8_BH09ACT8_43200 [soil metagenome]